MKLVHLLGLSTSITTGSFAADHVTLTLRDSTNHHVIAELGTDARHTGETVARQGDTRDLVLGWEFAADRDSAPRASVRARRFIGTEMRVNRAGADAPWEISFRHDHRMPDTHGVNYAMTAVGAERDRQSVPLPRLHRVEWSGSVLPAAGERTLAALTAPDGQKLTLSLRGGDGDSTPLPVLTHTMYRVAEKDVLQWLFIEHLADPALHERLERSGAVITCLQTALSGGTRSIGSAGTLTHITSEADPDYDRLNQMPVRTETAFTGTSLDVLPDISATVTLKWNSLHAPRPPLKVLWPASWLNVCDDATRKPTGRALHGWMDWFDRFEQRIVGSVGLFSTLPHLVSIMPPADQTWGSDGRTGRWLDVTLAQCDTGKLTLKSAVMDRAAIIGLRVPHAVALRILCERDSAKDDSLFKELMLASPRVEFCTLAGFTSGRREQTSARVHAFPTETPSFPSSWDSMDIGTRLQLDDYELRLDHDLAPPARTEWRLARDIPEIVMWEPRKRSVRLRLDHTDLVRPGTHLQGACSLPAIMQSADFDTKDTLLVFTCRERESEVFRTRPSPVDPFANTVSLPGERHPSDMGGPGPFSGEAFIFEINPKDSHQWDHISAADFATFATRQIGAQKASLLAQAMLGGDRGGVQVTEDHITATEFDSPKLDAPGRMRPTGYIIIQAGTRFELEVSPGDSTDSASVTALLRHTTSPPVEPSLEDMLRKTEGELSNHAGAKHDFVEWSAKSLRVRRGRLQCLGQKLSAEGKTLVAFVRVR